MRWKEEHTAECDFCHELTHELNMYRVGHDWLCHECIERKENENMDREPDSMATLGLSGMGYGVGL